MTDEKQKIGAQIKHFREARGMSQVDLDTRLYSRRVVCGWETGRAMPRADMICDLCTALECTPNELFGWKEKRKRK